MERIIGVKFNKIRRWVDMLSLELGKSVPVESGNEISEFTFHIQTSWRFVKGDQILLASRDIYLPQDPTLDDGDYDFEEQSTQEKVTETSTIFDAAIHDFDKHFIGSVVKGYQISPFGDLRIDFTNGVFFETFTPSSRKAEEWRFFTANENDDHVVVFDV